MEMGSVVITGERGAPNDFLLRVKLSRQACKIAISVPKATVLSLQSSLILPICEGVEQEVSNTRLYAKVVMELS